MEVEPHRIRVSRSLQDRLWAEARAKRNGWFNGSIATIEASREPHWERVTFVPTYRLPWNARRKLRA